MKLVTVTNAAGDVVAIFTAAKRKNAAAAAGMIGGTADDFPAGLNEFKSDAGKLPRGVKAFYSVELFKAGGVKDIKALPLLTSEGRLQTSAWAVDAYAKRVATADKSVTVRKAYWLLAVQCYAPDEAMAIELAKQILAEVLKGNRDNCGNL